MQSVVGRDVPAVSIHLPNQWFSLAMPWFTASNATRRRESPPCVREWTLAPHCFKAPSTVWQRLLRFSWLWRLKEAVPLICIPPFMLESRLLVDVSLNNDKLSSYRSRVVIFQPHWHLRFITKTCDVAIFRVCISRGISSKRVQMWVPK